MSRERETEDNGRMVEIPGSVLKAEWFHFPLSEARLRSNWRHFERRPIKDTGALQIYAMDAQSYIATLHSELRRIYAERAPLPADPVHGSEP